MPRKDKIAQLEWQRAYDAAHREEKRVYAMRTADVAKERWRRGYHGNIVRAMLRAAKSRAKKKGLSFTVSAEDITIPDACPLLGIPLGASRDARAPGSPSLDRKDPSKGYEPGNVWVISYRANRIKNDATVDEFLLMAKNLGALLTGERS